MKLTCHPELSLPKVFYFYLPALEDKPAEIIEVLHGNSKFIQVPLRDEDKRLKSFYQRPIVAQELARYGKRQTWQIFTSWQDLEQDHAQFNVPVEIVDELKGFKTNYSLSEENMSVYQMEE